MVASGRWPIGPKLLLLLMAGFYTFLTAGIFIATVWNDWHETRQYSESRALDLARLLTEHTRRVLNGADWAAQRLGDQMALAKSSLPAQQPIAAMLENAPFLDDLIYLDAANQVTFDAKSWIPVGTSWTHLDWVTTAHGAAPGTVVIGPPSFNPNSGSHTFPVARRLPAMGTIPGGIAVAMVNVGYFRQFHQQMDADFRPVLGISWRNGSANLLRQPLDDEQDVGDPPLPSDQAIPDAPIRLTLPEEESERVAAYQPLPDYGLVAWVALDEETARQAWLYATLRTLALAVISLIVTMGLTVVLIREFRRERKVAADMTALNRDLERSNADLEQFAYVASHDLKEPLRNIASYVQLLQRRYQGQLDADADAFIGYTVEGVARLQAIINELLAYSRIGTGQLAVASVQSGALISAALTHLKGVITEAQAAIEIKGPMPVVRADAAQLGSLFQNLIGNALKYRRDDVRPEVVIGCDDAVSEWRFYVTDNGIGIETQYHRQIFELFKRLHPRGHYPGTGIGLAVCQRVVERHGGRIWVESEAGKGSTFFFTLPKAS